jgi:hypothetical protein
MEQGPESELWIIHNEMVPTRNCSVAALPLPVFSPAHKGNIKEKVTLFIKVRKRHCQA